MTPLQQVAADTTQIAPAPFDSIWANADIPIQTVNGLDQVMLSNDKLYVVLAVVLIIWAGLIFFIVRTDRKLDRLERTMEERIANDSD